jgi:hypothetical protein
VGATLISFAAPVRQNQDCPLRVFAVHLSDRGKSGFGDQISLGPCQEGSAVLLTMYLVRTSQGSPCTPYAVKEGATAIDCSFVDARPGQGRQSCLNTQGSVPTLFLFQDELTGRRSHQRSAHNRLSWDGGYFVCFRPVAKTDSSPVSRGTRVFTSERLQAPRSWVPWQVRKPWVR